MNVKSNMGPRGFASLWGGGGKAPNAAFVLLTAFLLGVVSPSLSLSDPVFPPAQGTHAWRWPQDHGAHRAYKLEWWYYTGNLRGDDGHEYGFQVTFFRRALQTPLPKASLTASQWETRNMYAAHVAITDGARGKHVQAQRMGREFQTLAGADDASMSVWLGPWRVNPVPGKPHAVILNVQEPELGLTLNLESLEPPVLHGRGGLSIKGDEPGQASWYYSLPRMHASGQVRLGKASQPVTGWVWMDHEFGSGFLNTRQTGWDWMGLRLDSGESLMLYRLRMADGSIDPVSGGTWAQAKRALAFRLDGKGPRMVATRWWQAPMPQGTGPSLLERGRGSASQAVPPVRKYPVAWHIEWPERALVLEVEPLVDDQEMGQGPATPFHYWEGAVRVRGTQGGKTVAGQGYLELTGYGGSANASLR